MLGLFWPARTEPSIRDFAGRRDAAIRAAVDLVTSAVETGRLREASFTLSANLVAALTMMPDEERREVTCHLAGNLEAIAEAAVLEARVRKAAGGGC